tara:strand:+ start:2553 stop:2795 length:243 start_codon:yes stop_codon:yes gene_type:complete
MEGFKVWLLIAFLHTPSMPSVKYEATIFKTEHECYEQLAEFMNIYESKPESYKRFTRVDAHCLPFESFPIPKLMVYKTKF